LVGFKFAIFVVFKEDGEMVDEELVEDEMVDER